MLKNDQQPSDRRDRKTSARSASSAIQYQYNSAGPLSGLSVVSGYDPLLRRSSVSVLSSVSYQYDTAAWLQTVSNGTPSAKPVL
jgi:hypothetical protein